MDAGGADEAQGADALLSLAALAEQAESPDTQSGDEGQQCIATASCSERGSVMLMSWGSVSCHVLQDAVTMPVLAALTERADSPDFHLPTGHSVAFMQV